MPAGNDPTVYVAPDHAWSLYPAMRTNTGQAVQLAQDVPATTTVHNATKPSVVHCVSLSVSNFKVVHGNTQSLSPSAVTKDSNGNVLSNSFKYVSHNKNIATVDANGTVTAVIKGESLVEVDLLDAEGGTCLSVYSTITVT